MEISMRKTLLFYRKWIYMQVTNCFIEKMFFYLEIKFMEISMRKTLLVFLDQSQVSIPFCLFMNGSDVTC